MSIIIIKRTIFLILGIRLMYKFIILVIKRRQNNFCNFWNVGLVLMTLINWLLKLKMHANTCFWIFCYMKIWFENFL
jgi:hypothetical protein